MPFNYKIEPDLNLICYVGTGLCTGAELLKIEREAFHDTLRTSGMKIIVDIQSAEMDIDLQDIRDLIALNKQLMQEGHVLEMTALITHNKFFQTLGDAIQLLADGIPLKMGIFHTMQDAIQWLGLSESENQIIQIRDTLKEKSLNV
jgi:hypothetical protein